MNNDDMFVGKRTISGIFHKKIETIHPEVFNKSPLCTYEIKPQFFISGFKSKEYRYYVRLEDRDKEKRRGPMVCFALIRSSEVQSAVYSLLRWKSRLRSKTIS